MRRTTSRPRVTTLAAAATTLLLAAGCGSVEVEQKGDGAKTAPEPSPSASATVDTSTAEGDWLLAMTTAGGADGEKSTTYYVTYNPATGAAKSHSLPGVEGASATPEQAALLVSADRRWAIPDTGISHAEEKSGQLKVYSLSGSGTKVVDLRQRSGQSDVDPIGWAFDPARGDTLRVVDTKNRVWSVSVAGGKATQESTLTKGPWVFTNGFNVNTGQPYLESIDSDKTLPAGNGPSETTPVTRDQGTVLPGGSTAFTTLPQSPCRLGAGFTDQSGVTWAFCADDPTVTTYYLPKGGQQWTAYGKPSAAVAPTAAGFPLVLPPAA